MKVNEAKTELMLFGTTQMLRGIGDVRVHFNGATVTSKDQVRNLGVTFDRNLNFGLHVDLLVPKCTGMLLALNHAKHVIPTATVKYLVTALVFPVMRYCMSVYGICNKTQVRRVQKLINFAARIVSGRRRNDHISDVVRALGWLRADELVSYHRVLVIHRLISRLIPLSLVQTIGTPARRQHDHDTRAAGLLTLPRIRTETGRKRLCYSAVKMYNDVPKVVGISFKTAAKRYLRSVDEA